MKDEENDWIVGDRVWVDGNKPGYIQFIGETHFADGDWAGVVLDEPIGKNAGSVRGRRYFYCEPKRGMFTRLNRLSRYPMSGKISPDSGISDAPIRRWRTSRSVRDKSPSYESERRSRSAFRLNEKSPIRYRSVSPSYQENRERYYTLSSRPYRTHTKVSTATTTLEGQYRPGPLRVGDKVFVNSSHSGLVAGRLRYLGTTSFADGQWAGVELDEPVGKNDGQVAGKR
jgi:restin homolog